LTPHFSYFCKIYEIRKQSWKIDAENKSKASKWLTNKNGFKKETFGIEVWCKKKSKERQKSNVCRFHFIKRRECFTHFRKTHAVRKSKRIN